MVTIKLGHEWKKLGHRNELRLSREDCAALRRVFQILHRHLEV